MNISEILTLLNEEVTAIFRQFAEIISESMDEIKDKLDEILKNIEISNHTTYEPCQKLGFPQTPQIRVKLWRTNRALFRPYKRTPKPDKTILEKRVSYELF